MLSADANTSQHTQNHDFIGGLVNWWNTSPLFTRAVMFLSSGICVLSLFAHIEKFLVNIPDKTISEFQITRLIFSPFTFESIAELLFGLLAYLPLCAEQEKQWGTLKTLVDFFIKNLEINIFFLFNCWVFSFITNYFWGLSSYGLWGIFFVYLMERYLENPEGNTLFLSSPFQIPLKYYPIALFVLFCVITEAFRFDIIVAALLGFLHHRFLNVHYNELISDRKLANWEASSTVTWLKTIPRYTSPGSMPGALMDSYDQHGHGTSRGFGSPTYGHPNPNAHDSGYGGPTNTSKDFNQDVEDLISDAEQQK